MFAQNIGVLAAGGTAISVLFLIIAFISWLWNVFNGNQNAPAPGRQPVPPRGNRVEKELQAEINRFLKNVMGQKQREDDREVILAEEEEPRTRQKARAKQEAAKRKKTEPTPKSEESTTPGSSRPGGRIAQRKGPGSTTLGSGVRQHLAEHMQEGRVTQQAQNFLGHGVAEKVQHDLGTFSVADPAAAPLPASRTDRPTVTATNVAKLMRDPDGMKQAFVLNLILNRPSFGKRR